MRRRLGISLLVGCASCSAQNPEYVPPEYGCMPGVRTCIGARPLECVPSDAGGVLRNAPCSAAGSCDHGRCAPPSGATPCAREADCAAGQSCSAFVHASGAVRTYCAPPAGSSAGSLPCSLPQQCRSNLCLGTMSEAVKAICFLACVDDTDCRASQKCRSYNITITGVAGTILGCGPR